MIALLEASRAGLLGRAHWGRNLVAGLTVGIVALPLSMAFAIASGVKPEQGLYTAIIAALIVSTCGGSRIQIAGPVGAFIVILAGITSRFGADGLLLASLMAGAILVLMGLARFGGVIRYIPDPVVAGFTAGIAVIIWVGQWRDFFGLPAVAGERFHEQLGALLEVLPQLQPTTTLLALFSLLLVVYGPRLPGLGRVPGPLIGMLGATLLQALFGFEGVATLGSAFGGLPPGLPAFAPPAFDFDRMLQLLPAAFTLAMMGAIATMLSAVVGDGIAGTRHDPNQELIGQGLANLVAPLFGGFAAAGAVARTAANVRNGGNSPLSGLVHALLLVLVLLLLTPLAARVPVCALAAILFVVAWNMSELRHCWRMLHTAPRADAAILLITFALTLLTDLVIAVNIGVVLAMLQFLRRMADSVEVLRLDEQPLNAELSANGGPRLPPDVLVYAIDGPFFFAAVDSLEHALAETHTDPRCLVIRLGRVPFMDITGINALAEAILNLERRGVRVLLCEARLRVLRKLVRAGLVQRSSTPPRYFGDLAGALQNCQAPQALASAHGPTAS